MKRSLLKLIEYSVLPAVIIVLAKLGGIYLAAALFNIKLDVASPGNAFLFFQNIVDAKDIVLISSYSDIFMYLAIAVGMSVILIQALYLHNSHVSVGTINLLAKNDLLSLIRNSFELYHSGVIWLVFLWLANIEILINALNHTTDVLTLVVTTVFTISYSIIFAKDLFAEIELSKNGQNS